MANSINQFYYQFLNSYEASYTKRILHESVQLLGDLWIYLILGIVASTVIKIFVSKESMANFFSRKKSTASIVIASLIGVISPLGSYIIIPMSAALLGLGVPLSVLMALIVSTPLISPNIFVLTAGAMGIEMAIMRVLSAFILGCIAGYSTLWLQKMQIIQADKIVRSGMLSSVNQFVGKNGESKTKGFFIELYKMSRYVSKYFFLAVLLAAILKIMMNPKVIISLFSTNNLFSIILSTAAGVPFYVCGGAAIPVVQQLAEMGMSKGATLAYFISGPITKISNLIIIQAAFNKIILIQYLVVGILGAILIGLIYNLV